MLLIRVDTHVFKLSPIFVGPIAVYKTSIKVFLIDKLVLELQTKSVFQIFWRKFLKQKVFLPFTLSFNFR